MAAEYDQALLARRVVGLWTLQLAVYRLLSCAFRAPLQSTSRGGGAPTAGCID
jgi:hypothetical protein